MNPSLYPPPGMTSEQVVIEAAELTIRLTCIIEHLKVTNQTTHPVILTMTLLSLLAFNIRDYSFENLKETGIDLVKLALANKGKPYFQVYPNATELADQKKSLARELLFNQDEGKEKPNPENSA